MSKGPIEEFLEQVRERNSDLPPDAVLRALDEITHHLEESTAELEGRGFMRIDAEKAAIRAFGSARLEESPRFPWYRRPSFLMSVFPAVFLIGFTIASVYQLLPRMEYSPTTNVLTITVTGLVYFVSGLFSGRRWWIQLPFWIGASWATMFCVYGLFVGTVKGLEGTTYPGNVTQLTHWRREIAQEESALLNADQVLTARQRWLDAQPGHKIAYLAKSNGWSSPDKPITRRGITIVIKSTEDKVKARVSAEKFEQQRPTILRDYQAVLKRFDDAIASPSVRWRNTITSLSTVVLGTIFSFALITAVVGKLVAFLVALGRKNVSRRKTA